MTALGLTAGSIASLPSCRAIPETSSPGLAFGCAYVLEGATLGARTLLPFVETHLGLSAARGAAYLASYGEDVDAMWRAFNAAVESWCCDAQR